MANALYADEPSARLAAAVHVSHRHLKAMAKLAAEWPADSPGSLNAWLLLVTTKSPTWRDPYVEWRDIPPTLGSPHEGFFYPDPLGFWAEVRHWSTTIVREQMSEALSVTTVLHGAQHLAWALELMHPRVILFLDEPAADASHLTVTHHPHQIRDPFRAGQMYEGWWGESDDGAVVGKSPQHPAAHKLYTRTEMDAFLSWPGRTARS
ncbi:MAG TPA: hypothetical protein VFB78_04560 [Acidimicrobiales bacterium]|nr:hypothetical protein [Acidimicrobiales bacterium]